MAVSDDPQTKQSVTTDEMRDNLDAVLRRATRGKERLVIRRRSKAVAAIVPLEDIEYLEKVEDARDLALYRKAKRDWIRGGRKTISWEKVKRGLGS
jgi:prevent-host-death family protein